ncbi:MAG: PQQ-dependent sugar dehydrogenase [Hyphomicrobiales bacterium]
MFKKPALIAALVMLPATGLFAASAKEFKSEDHTFKVEVVAENLDEPWGFAFLPDGRILVTEKEGRLRRVNGSSVSEPFKGVPEVVDSGQGGLLDVAIDPAFEKNGRVYLTFSEPGEGGSGTAIVSAKLGDGALENSKVIFRQNKKTGTSRHFGSRIAFGRDGTLFFTIGDRAGRPRAQDPFDHAGSVLRINTDGSVPKDNPFADAKKGLPEIWSIGHRNAQGIDIHPQTGEIWTVSHGPRGGDEINKPEAGKNYGWPIISYGRHYSGGKVGEGTEKDGLEQPLFYWDPSIAPSSMTFYSGDLFPNWKGDMFVSALAGELVSRIKMDGDKILGEERLLEDEYGRIRRIKEGPDGALYAITDDGELLRISPAK